MWGSGENLQFVLKSPRISMTIGANTHLPLRFAGRVNPPERTPKLNFPQSPRMLNKIF